MQDIKNGQKNRRILIIDDNEAIHKDFREILQGNKEISKSFNVDEDEAAIFGTASMISKVNFDIDSAFQGQEGLEKIQQAVKEGNPYAMAFVDIRMPPGWDGIETIQHIWKVYPKLQVVICTAYSDYSWHDMIEKLGETEQLLILKKPFDNIEVRQMTCALMQKWELLNNLDRMVRERTKMIIETRDITVFALAKLAESRDPETGCHLERLRSYCQILAKQIAKKGIYTNRINNQFLKNLYRSSPLHDIGKVGIPDAILLKPGKLSINEFEMMKRHTVIGEEAILAAAKKSDAGCFLAMGAQIARSHHEKFDGKGYPDGLSGQQIPLAARIVALADVYDALTSKRVYKDTIDADSARNMIEEEKGKHFDPAIVEAFCSRWKDFLQVHSQFDRGNLTPAECLVGSGV